MKTGLISALLRLVLILIALAIVLPSNLQAATQEDIHKSPAEEAMVLIVNVAGLIADGPHSDVLVPIINVSASLLNPEETAVWRETDMTGHSKRKRDASPEQLTAAWTKISDIVGRMLVNELPQKR